MNGGRSLFMKGGRWELVLDDGGELFVCLYYRKVNLRSQIIQKSVLPKQFHGRGPTCEIIYAAAKPRVLVEKCMITAGQIDSVRS